MSSQLHFILFNQLPLIYGRVPKVANTSIKAALHRLLQQAPEQGARSTTDAFWSKSTHGETRLISPGEARSLRGSHFSFSFVRNPFDRLVSAYNNKVLELEDVTGPMHAMGLRHDMPFAEFLHRVVETPDDQMDVHLLPQASILCIDGKLIPSFVGQMEQMQSHWESLQRRLNRERLPMLGTIPSKNVRRGDQRDDLRELFSDPGLVRLVEDRYRDDISTFYAGSSVKQLISGEPLAPDAPIEDMATCQVF